MGLVAPRHVGSSRTRPRTRVPCIGRWVLNHSASREVLLPVILIRLFQSKNSQHILSTWKHYNVVVKITGYGDRLSGHVLSEPFVKGMMNYSSTLKI